MDDKHSALAQRLIELMNYFNITPLQLAKQMGDVRSEKLKNVLKGKNAMSFEALANIKRGFPTINLNWLISGLGSMLVHHQQNQTIPITISKDSKTAHIPVVSSLEMATYSAKCDEEDYVKTLPIIDDAVYGDKIYRDFEISNNDMAPLLFPGDYIRTYYIDFDSAVELIPKEQTFPNFIAVIVTYHQEVLIRTISDYSKDWVEVRGVNESVNSRKIRLKDIKEFWVTNEFRVRNLRFLG